MPSSLPVAQNRARQSRPFTRSQALENARFLEVLGQTGNARLAAREVRRAHSTMFERRSGHAGFAQGWDAAVAAAHARFHLAGGRRGPEGLAPAGADAGGKGGAPLDFARDERDLRPFGPAQDRQAQGERKEKGPLDFARDERSRLRTRGGEVVVVRTKRGKLQLRLAHRGKLTRVAEQAFLSALSATANVRLSAAAAGASARAFYRRRETDPGFRREFRLALQTGYERLEAAALRAALPASHAHDAWRHTALPPIPPMSPDQALQLLFLHEKSVKQSWDKPHRRRRRGETDKQYSMRLFFMWRAEQRQVAEEQAVARAERFEATGGWRMAGEEAPPPLPPLELVTGWSRASGRAPHHEGVALFGGWRLGDMLSHRSGTSMGAREK